MNQLNSVLLEGNLVRKPLLKDTKNGVMVIMTVATSRTYTQAGEIKKKTIYTMVEEFGEHAKETAELDKGRGLRVVGHLDQYTPKHGEGEYVNPVTFIHAEHIEYKPVLKNNTKAESDESAPNLEAAASVEEPEDVV